MFARVKKSGRYESPQIVHNERIDGRVRQRVIATLGRLDVLRENRQIDGLVESLARFSDHLAVLQAVRDTERSTIPGGVDHDQFAPYDFRETGRLNRSRPPCHGVGRVFAAISFLQKGFGTESTICCREFRAIASFDGRRRGTSFTTGVRVLPRGLAVATGETTFPRAQARATCSKDLLKGRLLPGQEEVRPRTGVRARRRP